MDKNLYYKKYYNNILSISDIEPHLSNYAIMLLRYMNEVQKWMYKKAIFEEVRNYCKEKIGKPVFNGYAIFDKAMDQLEVTSLVLCKDESIYKKYRISDYGRYMLEYVEEIQRKLYFP